MTTIETTAPAKPGSHHEYDVIVLERPGGRPEQQVRDNLLHVLGPTSWLLWEELRRRHGSRVNVPFIASYLGVQPNVLRKAIRRLVRYELVTEHEDRLFVWSHG